MSVLITAVVFGLLFAIFAVQNTGSITLNFGQYAVPNVPIYLLALGSLLFGLIVSWVISLFDNATSFLTIKSKEHSLANKEHTIESLQQKIHQLEVENAHISEQANQTPQKEIIHEHHEINHEPNLWDKLRYRLSV